jgi:cytochrome c biogenesis protein CcdA
LTDLLGITTMLLAGLLTSLSPCLFPVLPAYLVYAGKRSGRALKVTVVFTAAMALSLAAYALAASTAGYALVSQLKLSPSDAALLLSTLLLAIALAQLTPAKELGSLALKASPRVEKLDAAGAAALGALFALLAAPCASAPLLALAAKAALDPSSALPSIAAFSAGAALPFLVVGAAAHSVRQRIHRSVSRSFIVRRSGELTALLFTVYGIAGLWATGDTLLYIERSLPALRAAAPWLWGAVLLTTGALVLWASAGVNVRVSFLALLTVLAGLSDAVTGVLETAPAPFPFGLRYASLAVRALAAAAWTLAYIKGRGRVTKWLSIALFASLISCVSRCAPALPADFAPPPVPATFGVPLEYALYIVSFGLLPAPIALALDATSLRQ